MSDEESMMNGSMDAGPSQIASTSSSSSMPPPGMSKNQMKKAAKQARYQEHRLERRAAEKSKRKERDAALREGYAAGTLSAEDKAIYEKRKALKTTRKKDTGHSANEWKGGVIIDLGFDELMSDQEITSMASQLGFVYSVNRTAARPFTTVLHTSFGPSASPKLWKNMANRGWDRWTRSFFREGDMRQIGQAMDVRSNEPVAAKSPPAAVEVNVEQSSETDHENLLSAISGPLLPRSINPDTHRIIYLSADAEEELSTLSENEIYVIGGIVDRNRYKMLCQNKAVELGIRTARLPIGRYLADLPTRKVLTVNQVFEILSQYVTQNDWASAFNAVIPPRKYEVASKRRRKLERVSAGEADGDGEGVQEGVQDRDASSKDVSE